VTGTIRAIKVPSWLQPFDDPPEPTNDVYVHAADVLAALEDPAGMLPLRDAIVRLLERLSG
jgi:hypothetical protein